MRRQSRAVGPTAGTLGREVVDSAVVVTREEKIRTFERVTLASATSPDAVTGSPEPEAQPVIEVNGRGSELAAAVEESERAAAPRDGGRPERSLPPFNFLKWLYPGIGVKRWFLLIILGTLI